MKIEETLWSRKDEQGFKEIRPKNLVFDSTSPMFKLDRGFIKQNNPVKFIKIEANLKALKRVNKVLNKSDLVTYLLTQHDS